MWFKPMLPPNYLLCGRINWATKPHVGSEANFRGFFFPVKESGLNLFIFIKPIDPQLDLLLHNFDITSFYVIDDKLSMNNSHEKCLLHGCSTSEKAAGIDAIW